jgi:hypothetical protein
LQMLYLILASLGFTDFAPGFRVMPFYRLKFSLVLSSSLFIYYLLLAKKFNIVKHSEH